MKTIVTGGVGFIGSHLVKRLVEEGRDVVAVSDFLHIGKENLKNLGVNVRCDKVDLKDYSQAVKVMEGAETVFHLAAMVGGIEYLHGEKMPESLVLQTNIVIGANTFRACAESGVRKLIYASSSAVYPMDKQNSLGCVFAEDYSKSWVTNPDGGYGWAKLIGEVQLGYMKGIDISIARLFNVYGVNEPLGAKSHVVADLIRKAIAYPEADFTIWGDGNQARDFLYVTDCVEALLELEKKASSPPVIVNIGSGKATSIRELAEDIIHISGKDIKPVYDMTKLVGPRSRTADINKARTLLGWEPNVSLGEGLKRTYGWIENNRPDLHS